MKILPILFVFFLVFFNTSCARKMREVKYNAYEMIGMEKRDLFKREVKNVKEEQEETGEAYKDALSRLKEMYQLEGGDLEKEHAKLKSSYENANSEASELRERIAKVNEVAGDLFSEWQKEIKDISTESLQEKSKQQLGKTKSRFKELKDQMSSAEKRLAPVLTKLKDQVLFLKHNLNAKAIAGLKSESSDIEKDIKSLIKEVDKASEEAQKFIETL